MICRHPNDLDAQYVHQEPGEFQITLLKNTRDHFGNISKVVAFVTVLHLLFPYLVVISHYIIYWASNMKIDMFIPKPRLLDQDEHQHIHYLSLQTGDRPFSVSSPESMILRTLEWDEMGGRVSNRQWRDLLGILQKKADSLDLACLDRWANVLKVHDLLTQALQEAGLQEATAIGPARSASHLLE